jgi:hypothetical protein
MISTRDLISTHLFFSKKKLTMCKTTKSVWLSLTIPIEQILRQPCGTDGTYSTFFNTRDMRRMVYHLHYICGPKRADSKRSSA